MVDTIKNFIEGIIEKLGLNCEAVVTENEDEYKVELVGPDTSVLIGYRGDVLDSIQYLTLLLINKNKDEKKRLVIDGDGFRAKREQTLTKLAKSLAFQVSKSGQPKKLEPMNPFERRVIHSALADDKYVTTESEGEEPNRYVVITPNKIKKNYNHEKKTVSQVPAQENHVSNPFAKSKSFGPKGSRWGF